MRLPSSVKENLYFLTAETQAQLSNLHVLFETASETVAQRIFDRQGYAYNLKMRVHDGCVEALRNDEQNDVDLFSLRAADTISSDLERLTLICNECVRLLGDLSDKDALKNSDNADMLADVLAGLEIITKAMETSNPKSALELGEIESKLDKAYEDQFQKHLSDVKKSKSPRDKINSLFISQKIEEMGDVLLTIGQAIMSASMGQPMHIDRYRSLKTALSDLGLRDADVETIAETKSGSSISGISENGKDENGYAAIFKDGTKAKLKEERESVESWHEIYPGLAPQILSYKKRGKNAALLIEHLPGLTFEQIVLQADDALLNKAHKKLAKTLSNVWEETKKKKAVQANHMAQLKKRLPTVLDIHPAFDTPPIKIGNLDKPSLSQLIEKACEIEKSVEAPFSVYIHGDFNLDNIIFDEDSRKIRFIDLHRSCYQDYTQDVSVFMVSNYRLQVLDSETRRKIQISALALYDFAQKFAQQNNDETFTLRLTLGLIRSLITSTRFILDKGLAKAMFMRAIYLLERLNETPTKNLIDFELPIEELFS